MIGVDLRDLNPRRQPQYFRDAGCAGPPDVLLRDYVNRGWSFPDFFRLFRSGRHFNVAKLCQTQLLQGIIKSLAF